MAFDAPGSALAMWLATMTEPLAAVVLCAGKGTRMKSEMAKVLHPVLGRPLAAWPVGRAVALGCNRWWRWSGTRETRCAPPSRPASRARPSGFATQAEQWGTADAVRSALGALEGVSGAVLVLYGDTPLLRESTLRALVDTFRQRHGSAGAGEHGGPRPRRLRPGGARRAPDRNRRGERLHGGPALHPGGQRRHLRHRRGLPPRGAGRSPPANAQGELYLTDIVASAAQGATWPSVSADRGHRGGERPRRAGRLRAACSRAASTSSTCAPG